MCPLDVLFPDEGSGALKLEMSMNFYKISHHSEKNPTIIVVVYHSSRKLIFGWKF